MISALHNKFGSSDREWFCAAEAITNTIFNLKSKHSHEYAKVFIELLVRRLYQIPPGKKGVSFPGDEDPNEPRDAEDDGVGIASIEGVPLRSDLTEFHYA